MRRRYVLVNVSELTGIVSVTQIRVNVEFFANAKVIAGTVVSFIANRKLALTRDVFSKTFGLSTGVMASFLDIPNQTVVEMCGRFSGSDVPFRTPSKKKEMKIEFRLPHDIVAKALCGKAGSFDVVTSEKFDLMVAMSAGVEINWAQVLFQVFTAMVNNLTRQSQCFVVQLSVLLERLVKADLGKSVKFHPQKVLTNKSLHTYIKKNLDVRPAGESNKQTEDTTSGTDGGQSHMTKTDQEVAGQQPVEAGSQVAPTKSKSGTSSDEDSCPLERLKKRGAKRKQVVESSDSDATVSVPQVRVTKKHQTKRTSRATHTADQGESQPGPIPEIPARGDKDSTDDEHMECEYQTKTECQHGNVSIAAPGEQEKSTAGGPEGHVGTTPQTEGKIDDVEQVEQEESSNQTDKEAATNAGAIVVRSGPEQPAQQSLTFTGTFIFTPLEIREINWIYEMKVQKRVDEHRANFKPTEPFVNCDYMCIRFLSRELKEIARQHRDLRALAGLPLVAPKASIAGDAASIDIPQVTLSRPAQPQILAFEFSTQVNMSRQRQGKQLSRTSSLKRLHYDDVSRRFTMIRWFWKLSRSFRSDLRSVL
ncbi:hypothetical protein F511_16805 [Dorcoceras hygrometricum]|uniref:Uncharacterized protein n=1 Tax=Dorcoceras hygrometricum TaxID=472368 RepID=A0A2Z7CV42_9LAMI|nr:hypothetical protein F511_16805 [Dorcoceras hygrometricum]